VKVTKTALPGVLIIEPDLFVDERGTVQEDFNRHAFQLNKLNGDFVQDFHCKGPKAVLRGLHYQLTRRPTKVVRCAFGEAYNVAVDVRRGSPTFGKSVGLSLSAWNMKMLYVPPGFAHGFIMCSETADVLYKLTDYYDANDERGIFWSDPALGVTWPLADDTYPTTSIRDKDWPLLATVPADQLPAYEG